MNFKELLNIIESSNSIILITFIVITGCIEIAPIKLNPWTWIYNKVKNFIKNLFVGDVINEIQRINEEVKKYGVKISDIESGTINQKKDFSNEIKGLQEEIKNLHAETNGNISDVKRQTIDSNYQLVVLSKSVEQLNSRVDALNVTVDKNKEEVGEDRAKNLRRIILEFGDDLYAYPEKGHTKEWFDAILRTITEYLNYCSTHPDFKNEQAVMTIEHIRNVYQEMCEKHSFL